MKSLLGLFVLLLSLSTTAFIMEPHDVAKSVPTVSGPIKLKAMKAILDGDIATVKRMVESGIDPHFSVNGQNTILHTIATHTYFNHISKLKYPDVFSEKILAVLQYLVDQGANVNRLQGLNGSTPLAIALRGVDSDYPHCRANFIEFLLKNGADPDKGNRSSTTYRVWSPFENVTPFCGTKALEVYFSYKPNFKRGRCALSTYDTKEDQNSLYEYFGLDHYTPSTVLFNYLKSQGIPTPYIEGPFGHTENPKWAEYEKTCPDTLYYQN